MGNFEKLSVLVIVVIIVMILVVALYSWSDGGTDNAVAASSESASMLDDRTLSEPPTASTKMPEWPYAPDVKKEAQKDEPKAAKPPVVEPPAPTPPPATELATAPVVPAPVEKIHVVKPGETLGGIAQTYLGSSTKYGELLKANPGVVPERLQDGMKLKIPVSGGAGSASGGSASATGTATAKPDTAAGSSAPGGTYTVRSGDTLETISKRVYGTKSRWPEIWVSNLGRLDSPDDVSAGMVLQLPK
jgi:nucleoid-associated protein YgaU